MTGRAAQRLVSRKLRFPEAYKDLDCINTRAMTARDYQLLNLRYSCPLLSREQILEGKVPTAPTIARMTEVARIGAGHRTIAVARRRQRV